MLWENEAQLLFDTVSKKYTGSGELIDLGSFTGSSAYFMAKGLCSTPFAGSNKIHCFDRFVVGSKISQRFIKEKFDQHIDIGDSFRHIFENNLAQYSEHINVYECNFLEYSWSKKNVELLFIDLAKTKALHSKVVAEFFDCLETDKSHVFHQDFHWPALPWIAVTMHLLQDCFQITCEKSDTTRAWVCVKKPNKNVLEKCVNYEFNSTDQIAIIDEFCQEEKQSDRDTLPFEIMKLKLGKNNKEYDFYKQINYLKENYIGNPKALNWCKYFLNIDLTESLSA